MNYPKVSIIFPNHNGGNEPLECLNSIQKLNYQKDKIEIIVIDNNSQDSSDKKIREKYPNVKLLKNKENLGFAQAVNQGLKIARGQYVFIGNDDLVFEKNSLKNLIDFSLKNPTAGVLGGKIFSKSNPHKISSSGYLMNPWTGNVHVSKNPNKIKEPDWLQGCALLMLKKFVKKVGYLDPGYSLTFEDYDLCLRVKEAGFRVIYLPQAIFWHGESLTADKNKPDKYYNWYKNKIRFIVKNFPPQNILSILVIQIFIIAPYRALILRDGRLLPFLKGLVWNIKNFQDTFKARYNSRMQ